MIDIPSVGTNGHTTVSRIAARRTAEQHSGSSNGTARAGDSVEVSTVAHLLAKLSDLPDVRHDLVANVRDQISSGTYETPEKLDTAVDGMIQDAQTF